MERQLISIIIPVYNVEPYLPYCLDSIAIQTYTNFEAIMVDDGSTDSCGTICDNYCKQDNRFKVIHQKNQGLSQARNTGLSNIRGEYVCFIDSDDYIHSQFLETLYSAIKHTGCEIAMVNGIITDKYTRTKRINVKPPKLLSQEELIRNMFLVSSKNLFFLVIWNKLFTKNIIKGLSFKNTISEDGEFNLQVYLRVPQIAFVKNNLYYYVQHNNSLTHNCYKSKRCVDEIQSYNLFFQHLTKDCTQYRSYALEKFFKQILNIRYNARDTEFKKYSEIEINKAKNLYLKEFKSNTFISRKMKIVILTFLRFPFLYSIFRWLSEKKVIILK